MLKQKKQIMVVLSIIVAALALFVFGDKVSDAKKVQWKNSKPYHTVKTTEKLNKGDPCINAYRLSLMENRAVRVATKTAIRAELSRTAPIAYLSGLWVFPIDLQCVYSKPVVRNSLANHLEGNQWEESLDNLTKQMPPAKAANVPGRVGIVFYPDSHLVPDVDSGMFIPGLEGILDGIRDMISGGGVGQGIELGPVGKLLGKLGKGGGIAVIIATEGHSAGEALLRATRMGPNDDYDGDGKTNDEDEDDDNDGVPDDEDEDPYNEDVSIIGSCKPPLFCMDFTGGLDSNSWNTMIDSYSLLQSSLEHNIGATLPSGGAITNIAMVFDNTPALELTMK